MPCWSGLEDDIEVIGCLSYKEGKEAVRDLARYGRVMCDFVKFLKENKLEGKWAAFLSADRWRDYEKLKVEHEQLDAIMLDRRFERKPYAAWKALKKIEPDDVMDKLSENYLGRNKD